MATEQVGICENCRQLAICVMVEIAPCVRMRLCRACPALLACGAWLDTLDPAGSWLGSLIMADVFRGCLRAHNSAGSMPGSRRSLQDDDPDGDVVADRRGRGERMKELVIAEGLWPGVGPAKAVKDSADVVQHTFGGE